MILDKEAAQFGLLVQIAMDMGKTPLTPPGDGRLAGSWNIVGYLAGVDEVLGVDQPVCYGFLAESRLAPGHFVAAIRGTAGALEWVLDSEFLPRAHPRGYGLVESGFWEVYERLGYIPAGGTTPGPLVPGIAAAVGSGSVTVTGHSLGSALASYLTLDLSLALKREQVAGSFLASPHPGDGDFAAAFEIAVNRYTLWNYEPDIVSHLPAALGFEPLHRAQIITMATAQARIKFGLDYNHHCLSYCAMLDYQAQNWAKVRPIDLPYAAGILGPNSPSPMSSPI